MKKTLPLIVLGSVLFAQPGFCASLDAVSGKVFVAVGSKRVMLDGKTRLPRALTPGTHVATGSEGRARVVLEDQSEIVLAPSSELVVPEPGRRKNAELGMPQVLYGLLRVFVKKHVQGPRPWKIRARNAVMGVRGTEFVIDASRDRTIMCALSGKVAVSSREDPTHERLVKGNQGVVISSEGRVSPPVTMDGEQMNWWRRQTAVGALDTPELLRGVTGFDWDWMGPTAVDSLDPNAMYSQYSLFSMNAALWAHVVKKTGLDPGFTTRAALKGLLVPNRTYLIYAVPTVVVPAGKGNSDSGGFRLHQAFAMARLDSTHSLTIGRQEWKFGDGLLIGNDPWEPFSVSYDGALADLRWAPLRVRLFGSSLEDRTKKLTGEDWMAGGYGNFSVLPLELYAIWVKRGATQTNIATSNKLQSRFGIFGFRTEPILAGPLFADLEVAHERGTIGTSGFQTQTLSSLLGYADLGVTFRSGRVNGALKGVYLGATGDSPGAGDFGAFISLRHDTHRFLGLVNAFPQLRNIQRAGATLEVRVPVGSHAVGATLDYSHFSRMRADDTVYPRVAVPSEKDLGDELDLLLDYDVMSWAHVQLGGGVLKEAAAFGADAPRPFVAFLAAQLSI